jgi:hypothetical protein
MKINEPNNLYTLSDFKSKILLIFENIEQVLKKNIIDDILEYNLMISGRLGYMLTPSQKINILECLQNELNKLTNYKYTDWTVNKVIEILNVVDLELMNNIHFKNADAKNIFNIIFDKIKKKLYGENYSILNNLILTIKIKY